MLSEVRTIQNRLIWKSPIGNSDSHGWINEDSLSQRALSKSEKINKEILNILKVFSHDTRGSLTNLAAGLKLLKKGAYGKMDKTVSDEIDQLFIMVRGLIGTLEESVGRAFSINGGLEMCQERLQLNQDILRPVLLELSKEMRSRSITVEEPFHSFPDADPVILGDGYWLKAVFRNLLTNAIKYGGKGCKITIGFEDLGFHYGLNVHNTGIPVPEEFRDRLFTKFGCISSKDNEKSESMGLGLYLVKDIIEKHDGFIWYEATPTGSNFVMILPNI